MNRKPPKILAYLIAITVPLAIAMAATDTSGVYVIKGVGTKIAGKTTDKIGAYGVTPTPQPAGAGQQAITDSTTGTAATTAAAGTGVQTLAIPIQLAAMTTAAADLVTNYTPGYKFKILAVDFVTTTLGTGSGASQTLNLEIGTTNVTGGVVNATLGSTDTLGKLTAGTTVTAANTGTVSDTLSVEVATGGTVFTAGSGILLVKIQNMDTADAHASELRLVNAIRAALVALGWMKGGA